MFGSSLWMLSLMSSSMAHAFGLALLHKRPLLVNHYLCVGAGELLDMAPLRLR